MVIPGRARLRAFGRRIRDAVKIRLPSTNPLITESRWLIPLKCSLAEREVCLLVTLARSGRITDHALFLAKAWADQGFAVVLIVAADEIARIDQQDAVAFCQGVLVRKNVGYDFGAWAACIRQLPGLGDAALVATTNDSAFGPMATFNAMLARVRCAHADIVGTIGSAEHRQHLQSFLLFFKPAALRSKAFSRFWNGVRNGDREFVIDHYEEPLEEHFRDFGLKTTALYPAHAFDCGNPSLHSWRSLIAMGFPFVKIQLLRDNPFSSDISGWRALLASQGYDPRIAERHLVRYSPDAVGLCDAATILAKSE